MREATIKVPASAANLGPGFDCLAMALSLTNTFEFSLADEGLQVQYQGPFSEKFPSDESNLAVASFYRLSEQSGAGRPGLRLQARAEVPPASGLGSSSTAVVAGLLAANHLLKLGYGPSELLEISATIEGHADNAAAALHGGLVGVTRTAQGWDVLRLPMAPLQLVIVVPEVKLSTQQMRAILPPTLPIDQAVTNAAGLLSMQHALASADFDRLRRACRVSFHQDARLPHIAGARQAMAAAQAEGAAAVLAGAGPGVLAMAADGHSHIAAVMVEAFKQAGVKSSALIRSSSADGAIIQATG